MDLYFFVIFALTILLIRMFLWFYPISSPTFGIFRIHHYMYGILGIALGLVLHSIIIYAIGFGFFIDELTYLLIRGKTHNDNYSKMSLVGTFIFIVLTFIIRKPLVDLLYFIQ